VAVRRSLSGHGRVRALYNYIGFRLLAPPFNLSQTAIGAIFIVYLVFFSDLAREPLQYLIRSLFSFHL
jgi:hypothetical protein